MIEPFRKVRTTNNEVRQLQDATAAVFRTMSDREILDGQLLRDISLVALAVTRLDHKLGRDLIGWSVVRKSATCDIWDGQADNISPGRSLLITASQDVTISLWVF